MSKRDKLISYCITVCNEHKELKKLLEVLLQHINKTETQVLIQGDKHNITDEVIEVIKKYKDKFEDVGICFDYITYPLNGHFADFKNNLSEYARGEWIFQIDADEIPTQTLATDIIHLVTEYSEMDIFRVSRVNIVQNLTMDYITKWGWHITTLDGFVDTSNKKEMSLEHLSLLKRCSLIINENEDTITYKYPIINWPDHQWRIYRNNDNIRWINAVHEVLAGSDRIAYYTDPEWSLIHVKTLRKQIQQNKSYEKFQ